MLAKFSLSAFLNERIVRPFFALARVFVQNSPDTLSHFVGCCRRCWSCCSTWNCGCGSRPGGAGSRRGRRPSAPGGGRPEAGRMRPAAPGSSAHARCLSGTAASPSTRTQCPGCGTLGPGMPRATGSWAPARGTRGTTTPWRVEPADGTPETKVCCVEPESLVPALGRALQTWTPELVEPGALGLERVVGPEAVALMQIWTARTLARLHSCHPSLDHTSERSVHPAKLRLGRHYVLLRAAPRAPALQGAPGPHPGAAAASPRGRTDGSRELLRRHPRGRRDGSRELLRRRPGGRRDGSWELLWRRPRGRRDGSRELLRRRPGGGSHGSRELLRRRPGGGRHGSQATLPWLPRRHRSRIASAIAVK